MRTGSRHPVSRVLSTLAVPAPRSLFLVLLWVNSLPVIASTSTAPTLPLLAREFAERDDVDRLIPLIITLGPLAVALSGALVGLVIDRFGRRPVLVTGAILYGVAGAAPVLMDDLALVVATRAGVGVAVCCLMTAATTVISDSYQGTDRARILALQAGIVGFVAMIFIVASGFLAEWGWRPPFLVFLVGLPLVPLILTIVPVSRPREVAMLEVALDAPPLEGAAQGGGVERPLRSPMLPLRFLVPVLYVSMLALQATNFLAIVQLPFLLEGRFGAGPSAVGSIVALATLAYAIGALWSVRLAVRYEPRVVVVVASSAIGLANLGMAVGGLPVVTLANLLGGIGFGLIVPNLIAWLAAVAPVRFRGRLFGGIMASLFLGQFLSAPLWAPVVASRGSAGALAAAGVAWLAVGFFLRLRVRLVPVEGAEPTMEAPT